MRRVQTRKKSDPSRKPIGSLVDVLGDLRLGGAADLAGDLDGVDPCETSHAELLFGKSYRPHQPLVADVAQRVSAPITASTPATVLWAAISSSLVAMSVPK